VKERPILLNNSEMVRAVLNHTKTQHRIVVDPQPLPQHHIRWVLHLGYQPGWAALDFYSSVVAQFECPFGVPGDRLWVQEAWAMGGNGPYYKADVTNPGGVRYAWTPSTDMPRWASRITLEITDVRCQRLQEITTNDAIAEGIDADGGDDENRNRSTVENFRLFWDSFYKGKGFGWEKNPWVWASTFRRLP